MAMGVEIKVPQLGESVSEATVARWLKKPGEAVAADEAVVELETDKVTLEVNAPQAGTLSDIAAKEGDSVTVGALLGTIGESGATPAKSGKAAPKPEPAQAAKPAAAAQTASSQAAVASSAKSEAIDLSGPAARKLVQDAKIDPSAIQGTGKDGRITKGDALSAAAKPAPAPQPTQPRLTHEREERVRMTRLRQRIAERLKEAQNTAALLTTFNEVDMSAILKLRAEYKDAFEKKHKVKLGFMSFFVKAAVMALKEFPAVNAEIDGQDIVYKNHYDIGVAVSTPTGLVVPVVRDCEAKNFAEIEKTIGDMGVRARDGKLALKELAGILGMHKIQERPVAVNGQVVIRPMMYLALSYDHRIIDGREAVSFLVRVKDAIETPERLLLDL
jgi:2-oxoglutarate dehydrogenase E2 component (dihydrolipoamide succinyltransferase)